MRIPVETAYIVHRMVYKSIPFFEHCEFFNTIKHVSFITSQIPLANNQFSLASGKCDSTRASLTDKSKSYQKMLKRTERRAVLPVSQTTKKWTTGIPQHTPTKPFKSSQWLLLMETQPPHRRNTYKCAVSQPRTGSPRAQLQNELGCEQTALFWFFCYYIFKVTK